MKQKKFNKKYYFVLFIFLYIIFPYKINAYQICGPNKSCNPVNYTVCGGSGSYGTYNDGGAGQNLYGTSVSSCRNESVSNSGEDNGYPECMLENYAEKAEDAVRTKTLPNGREQLIYATVGMMDAWSRSGDGNGWNIVAGLGVQTCPGMNITYSRTDPIPKTLKDKKNVKVTNIKMLLNRDDLSQYWSGKALNDYYNWSVQDASIELFSDDVSDGFFSFRITINNLRSKVSDVNYLGMNGRVGESAPYVRSYHYFLPMEITFEYDSDITTDPCQNQQYAYENPEVCCNINTYPTPYYPEACCSNADFIKSLDRSKGYLDFCCTGSNNTPPTTQAYYGDSQSKNLPPLKTFAAYFYNDNPYYVWNRDIVGPNGICPTCDKESDYYPTDDGKGSTCCQTNPDSEYASNCKKENKCDITKCSTNFNENKSCCCDLDTYKNTAACKNIPDDDWADDLSCKVSPDSASNKIFATSNAQAIEGTDTTITENVKLTNYKTLSEMQNNILKAGTGFDYPVTVEHTVKRTYTGSTSFNYDNEIFNNCDNKDDEDTDTTCIENVIKDIVLKATTYDIQYNSTDDTYNREKDVNKIKNTIFKPDDKNEQAFKFEDVLSSETPSENYILTGDITSKDVVLSDDQEISYSYRTCNGNNCTTNEDGKVTVKTTRSYIYSYNMILKQKYINKTSAKIENADKIIENSTKKEYLDGEYKHYTSTKATTGIYDFKITIKDSGITGKLSSTDNGFTCQYGIYNEITENGTICLNTGVPTPCPNDDKAKGFYFRQISLTSPFASRNVTNVGSNWARYYDSTKKGYKYINFDEDGSVKNDSVYGRQPLYSIHLNPSIIKEIKEYNRFEESDNRKKGYLDWNTMKSSYFNNLDSISSFWTNDSGISGVPTINWGKNLTINSNYDMAEKIGDFKKVGES